MNEVLIRRLDTEGRLLHRALPQLAQFVKVSDTVGSPPVSWLFQLAPFGWLVRRQTPEGPAAPEPYAGGAHGPAWLSLATNPDTHPYAPWVAQVLTAPGIDVFNPHALARPGPGRGGICWHSCEAGFYPAEWPLPSVLLAVLRILGGEVELEGYALDEDAKVWFAEHRHRLPFARIPLVREFRPGLRLRQGRGASASALGIEFGGAR